MNFDCDFSSVKGQIVNIWDFSGYEISVATIQLCYCDVRAAIRIP